MTGFVVVVVVVFIIIPLTSNCNVSACTLEHVVYHIILDDPLLPYGDELDDLYHFEGIIHPATKATYFFVMVRCSKMEDVNFNESLVNAMTIHNQVDDMDVL